MSTTKWLWDGRGMNYTRGYSMALLKVVALAGGLIVLLGIVINTVTYIYKSRSHKV